MFPYSYKGNVRNRTPICNCNYFDLIQVLVPSVDRDGLWRITTKKRCIGWFITIERQLHIGVLARVKDSGETSNQFPFSD